MTRPAASQTMKKVLLRSLFAATLMALIGFAPRGSPRRAIRKRGRSRSTSSTRTDSSTSTPLRQVYRPRMCRRFWRRATVLTGLGPRSATTAFQFRNDDGADAGRVPLDRAGVEGAAVPPHPSAGSAPLTCFSQRECAVVCPVGHLRALTAKAWRQASRGERRVAVARGCRDNAARVLANWAANRAAASETRCLTTRLSLCRDMVHGSVQLFLDGARVGPGRSCCDHRA